jgi:hypothetical protein
VSRNFAGARLRKPEISDAPVRPKRGFISCGLCPARFQGSGGLAISARTFSLSREDDRGPQTSSSVLSPPVPRNTVCVCRPPQGMIWTATCAAPSGFGRPACLMDLLRVSKGAKYVIRGVADQFERKPARECDCQRQDGTTFDELDCPKIEALTNFA